MELDQQQRVELPAGTRVLVETRTVTFDEYENRTVAIERFHGFIQQRYRWQRVGSLPNGDDLYRRWTKRPNRDQLGHYWIQRDDQFRSLLLVHESEVIE